MLRTSFRSLVASFRVILLTVMVLPSFGRTTSAYCQETIPDTLRLKADEFFLEAHRQQLLGNQDASFELLTHSLELNPYSPPTMYELAFAYIQLRKDSIAIDLMKRAIDYAPENYWYRDALVKLYAQSNRIDDAIGVLEDMSVKYPGKTDVLAMLESLYSTKQDWKNVIKTLDKIENIDGKSEQLSLEKFRTYIVMKDEKSAYKEMVALADEYPNDLRYRVLIGDLLMEDGKTEEAFNVYGQVAQEDPENINLMLSMAEYYKVTSQDSLYNLQLEKVITAPKIDPERRFAIMNNIVIRNIQSQSDTTDLMNIFRKTLSAPQLDAEMCELALRYMVTSKADVSEIRSAAEKMIAIDPEHSAARSLLLQYAVEDNDHDEIIKVCTPAVEYGIDDPVFYYYLGIAQFQKKDYPESIEVLKSLVSRFKDTKILEIITNSYSILGDAYHQMDDDRNAFLYYDTCLVYRPEDPMVLNNYAYYLSLIRKDLDRAERMSALSLQKDSANYTYIDTYAWILFQQKKYKEARQYIDSAVNIMLNDTVDSSSANIFEHAGDIYSKCGLTDKAVEFWQKALSLDNERQAIIEKKIKKRKYIE